MKKSIGDKQAEENEFLQASNRSKSVLVSIKLTIVDLIHKLQEVFVAAGSIEMETNEDAPNHVILEVGEPIRDKQNDLFLKFDDLIFKSFSVELIAVA